MSVVTGVGVKPTDVDLVQEPGQSEEKSEESEEKSEEPQELPHRKISSVSEYSFFDSCSSMEGAWKATNDFSVAQISSDLEEVELLIDLLRVHESKEASTYDHKNFLSLISVYGSMKNRVCLKVLETLAEEFMDNHMTSHTRKAGTSGLKSPALTAVQTIQAWWWLLVELQQTTTDPAHRGKTRDPNVKDAAIMHPNSVGAVFAKKSR